MRVRRTRAAAASVAALAASLMVAPVSAIATPTASADRAAPAAAPTGDLAEYVVLLAEGADRAAGVAAVERAGGRVVGGNAAIGTLRALGPARGFVTAVSAADAVEGAAANQRIGRVPDLPARRDAVEREHVVDRPAAATAPAAGRAGSSAASRATAGLDPLDDLLWGLRMVRSDLAREVNAGRRAVKVGILDSGIDARNPDLAPNFDRALSRNFAPDIPEIDGPCEFRGCVDPADWDDSGHGTHVAGTVGAAANGFGLSGVAPNVTLVNIRGGQDSGYLFLGPVTDALTYGADAGLDVINMSFYVDPWLYNCLDNPADSEEDQAEQRTIIRVMRRALTYANSKGVTLVGALGNNHEDLGNPRTDESSPDFPPGSAYPRPIDNETCFDLPAEGPYVVGVAALGPSSSKADYSNYGREQTDVSAPGGWYRDYFGTSQYRTNENLILSSYPVNALQGECVSFDPEFNCLEYAVDRQGRVTPGGREIGVKKRCPAGVANYRRCGYYAYLQGTSMASPHATGVAALIVSQYGRARSGGFGMDPAQVRRVLFRTAQDRACPDPRTVDYLDEGRDETWTATCRGGREFNGFYGHGIVDAYRAVTYRRLQ